MRSVRISALLGASVFLFFLASPPVLAALTCDKQNGNGSIQCTGSNYWCGNTCQPLPSPCPGHLPEDPYSVKTEYDCTACTCSCPADKPNYCAAAHTCQATDGTCAGQHKASVCDPTIGALTQICDPVGCLGGYTRCGVSCIISTDPSCPSPATWDPCTSTCSEKYVLSSPTGGQIPQAVSVQVKGDVSITGNPVSGLGNLKLIPPNVGANAGNIYMYSGKAIHVDATSATPTSLNIGNWYGGTAANDADLNLYGSFAARDLMAGSAFSQFVVSSTGDLTKVKNVPYSWPAANVYGALRNDGSGTLSWSDVAPVSGSDGYWRRTGATLSQAYSNDFLNIQSSTSTPIYGVALTSGMVGIQANNNGGAPAMYANNSSTTAGYGVYGDGYYAGYFQGDYSGVYGSGGTYGLYGTASSFGVYGSGNYGVYGISAGGYAVYGNGNGGTYSLFGTNALYGVTGVGSNQGVAGWGGTYGVYGNGTSSGVYGSGPSGVYGFGTSSAGVYGQGVGGVPGVYGTSTSGNGTGVFGTGALYGVYGSGPYGVYGSGTAYAGYFYGNGGSTALYSYNTNGYAAFFQGKVGIGTTIFSPAVGLHVLNTTEQLRLGYDAANYASFTTSSAGDLTVAPTGGDLTVSGTFHTNAIQISTGAAANNVLTAIDASGLAQWRSAVFANECTGGKFDHLTGSNYNGNLNGGTIGYAAANALCGVNMHVCTPDEIFRSIYCTPINPLPGSGNAWLNMGPPGFTSPAANDCNGWTSNSGSNYGAFWQFGGTSGGKGFATSCSVSLKFACCNSIAP
jgi:hypothetical protein